jgi:hypothetical protein
LEKNIAFDAAGRFLAELILNVQLVRSKLGTNSFYMQNQDRFKTCSVLFIPKEFKKKKILQKVLRIRELFANTVPVLVHEFLYRLE